MEQLGQITCNGYEEVRVSLKEVCQKWYIEFRIYERPDDGRRQPRPGRDIINLPVEQLPLLLERLGQAKDICLSRGLLWASVGGDFAPAGRADAAVRADRTRVSGIRARQHPRLPVRYAAVCQPMGVGKLQRSTLLRGELRDLSVGGAQIWLPCRIGLAQQVEVSALIQAQPFRAKAEIVGASLRFTGDPATGSIRHSLKWITYNAGAADILTMTLLPPDVVSSPADGASEAGQSGESEGCLRRVEAGGDRPPVHPGVEALPAGGRSLGGHALARIIREYGSRTMRA